MICEQNRNYFIKFLVQTLITSVTAIKNVTKYRKNCCANMTIYLRHIVAFQMTYKVCHYDKIIECRNNIRICQNDIKMSPCTHDILVLVVTWPLPHNHTHHASIKVLSIQYNGYNTTTISGMESSPYCSCSYTNQPIMHPSKTTDQFPSYATC